MRPIANYFFEKTRTYFNEESVHEEPEKAVIVRPIFYYIGYRDYLTSLAASSDKSQCNIFLIREIGELILSFLSELELRYRATRASKQLLLFRQSGFRILSTCPKLYCYHFGFYKNAEKYKNRFLAFQDNITAISLTPDGSFLAISLTKRARNIQEELSEIQLINHRTGEIVTKFSDTASTDHFSISNDSKRMIAIQGGLDQDSYVEFTVFDFESQSRHTLYLEQKMKAFRGTADTNRNILVTAQYDESGWFGQLYKTIKIWDANTTKCIYRYYVDSLPQRLIIADRGKIVISIHKDMIIAQDIVCRKQLYRFSCVSLKEYNGGGQPEVVLSQNTQTLAIEFSRNGAVGILNVRTGDLAHVVYNKTVGISTMAFLNQDTQLAVYDDLKRRLNIWDIKDGSLFFSKEINLHFATKIAAHGELFFIGGDNIIQKFACTSFIKARLSESVLAKRF